MNIRKVPGAARKLLHSLGSEYTVREWSEALGVTKQSINELARREGFELKRLKSPWSKGDTFEAVRARREARIAELAQIIEAAVLKDPDPPRQRKKHHRRAADNGHFRRGSHVAEQGVSRTALSAASMRWGR